MSNSTRSFWSSVPGFVTGIAGVVGAIVGLISVLIALGVIGGSDSSKPTSGTDSAVSTTSPSSRGTTGSGATGSSAGTVSFTVDRPGLTLKPLAPTDNVKVTNQGSVALAVKKPELSGDTDKFSVNASDCTTRKVPVDGFCEIKVTYQGTADATAVMTVDADNAAKPVTVNLKATLL